MIHEVELADPLNPSRSHSIQVDEKTSVAEVLKKSNFGGNFVLEVMSPQGKVKKLHSTENLLPYIQQGCKFQVLPKDVEVGIGLLQAIKSLFRRSSGNGKGGQIPPSIFDDIHSLNTNGSMPSHPKYSTTDLWSNENRVHNTRPVRHHKTIITFDPRKIQVKKTIIHLVRPKRATRVEASTNGKAINYRKRKKKSNFTYKKVKKFQETKFGKYTVRYKPGERRFIWVKGFPSAVLHKFRQCKSRPDRNGFVRIHLTQEVQSIYQAFKFAYIAVQYRAIRH